MNVKMEVERQQWLSFLRDPWVMNSKLLESLKELWSASFVGKKQATGHPIRWHGDSLHSSLRSGNVQGLPLIDCPPGGKSECYFCLPCVHTLFLRVVASQLAFLPLGSHSLGGAKPLPNLQTWRWAIVSGQANAKFPSAWPQWLV